MLEIIYQADTYKFRNISLTRRNLDSRKLKKIYMKALFYIYDIN